MVSPKEREAEYQTGGFDVGGVGEMEVVGEGFNSKVAGTRPGRCYRAELSQRPGGEHTATGVDVTE